MQKFKLFDRGAKHTILLIPGWATDYRIFSPLDLNLNYLMPIEFSPFDFESGFLKAMEDNNLKKISILGWSMGGFIAFDTLVRNRDRINKVIFVSVRRRYEKEAIENIRILVKKNRKAFLYRFYNDCFTKNEESQLSWFRKHLLKSYLNSIEKETLVEGLDYLMRSQIEPSLLNDIRIKFIHGEGDKVAPIEEARKLKDDLPQAEFISYECLGHMPFLNPHFKRIFDGNNI